MIYELGMLNLAAIKERMDFVLGQEKEIRTKFPLVKVTYLSNSKSCKSYPEVCNVLMTKFLNSESGFQAHS
jgi:hypothetical protein